MSKLHPFYRDTWAEVNLNAISENLINIQSILPKGVETMAVVKANAYGHGAIDVAKAALSSGATFLGVAILDEAIALREAGITAPILVLGHVRPENAIYAAEKGITLTVFQKDWVEKVAQEIDENTPKIKCHVKIDTGMGRIGIRTIEEGKALIRTLKQSPLFEVDGIYTHYATADEVDTTYVEIQQGRFDKMVQWFEREWGQVVPYKHCANSATTLRFAERSYNLVRVGISMYGLSPSEEIKDELPVPLIEAFSLHSRITQVKQMTEGEFISYGATYETKENEWIATIPIGYADGWIRAHSGGDVLVDGRRRPIVGRICMDQLMVSLDERVEEGTKVTLLGKQGEEHITIDEVARRLQTISYEIPCSISYRVPRAIMQNNQISHVHNKIF
ncbi:alanine racemase [Bacillus shivajii]|uniref:alanine racemase n=1 Tax=Bacillus shivajii TaxID=1983719 RepID=UPI001CFB15B4|nr:alanine racemase [Bacillus shivajii]UCZ53682.1 alanine racemase [Bacillus shivajii]